ncbi:MAG: hypothetical protein MJZ81_10755 [Bacteroidales bacterium]|nr:hypothetical protein [Bacteroidales bacterium]
MKIKLKNYCDEWSEHDIGETSDIVFAVLKELSGDEVLFVYRSGNRSEVYDSDTNGRHTDYDDGSCVVFSEGKWDDEFLIEHEVKDLSKGLEPDDVSPKKAPDAKANDEPKRTRITNAEAYKTAEERARAFNNYCDKCSDSHGDCKPHIQCHYCHFAWLDLEAEEEPLPCPFCGSRCLVIDGSMIGPDRHGVRPYSYVKCESCGYESIATNDYVKSGIKDIIAAHNRVAKAVMAAKKEGER